MRNKIVILLGSPFSSQNFERIGLITLANEFEVAVLDCTTLLKRSIDDVNFDLQTWKNYYHISNYKEFEEVLRQFEPNYALDFIGFVPELLKISRILRKNSVQLVIQKSGLLPIAEKKYIYKSLIARSHWESNITPKIYKGWNFRRTFRRFNFAFILVIKISVRITEKIKIYFFLKKLEKNAPSIGLLSGNRALDGWTSLCKNIIWTGSNDYHKYNEVSKFQGINSSPRNKYILFIDDCVADASDWKVLKIKAPVTQKKYFEEMCNAFNELESYYKMPVYIAGHPNSLLDVRYSEKFGSRKTSFSKTAELARDASLVLIHGSTATSFAVLSQKPIISLTSDELEHSHYAPLIHVFSELLGTKICNISEPNFAKDLSKFPKVDLEKYRNYKQNYLISEKSTETTAWQSLIDYIKSEDSTRG